MKTNYVVWLIFIYHLILVVTSHKFAAVSAFAAPSYSDRALNFARIASTRNEGQQQIRDRRRNASSNLGLSAVVPSLVEDATQFILAANEGANVNELIRQAFSVATFFPQPFWILLILLPNATVTKLILGDFKVVTLFCLVHLFIVLASISEPNGTAPMIEFANVFDPAGNQQEAMVHMMTYKNFVSEEWSHVLTWDLLVGRWIWLDGLRRGIFTSHSVLLTNLIGPPGLLLHFVTCWISGKGVEGNKALDTDAVDKEAPIA